MKIRSDFVSNSSSSSFVIVGKTFDKEEVRKLIDKKGNELLKTMKENKSYLHKYEDIDEVITNWGMFEVFDAIGLNAAEEGDCGDGDNILIGIDPSKMKDDQTLKEFKENVVKSLKDFGLMANVKDIQFVSGGTDSSGFTFIDSCG